MNIGSKTIAVINTLANVYASHRGYSGFFAKIRTAEWSNIFISPAVLLIATILKNAGHTVRIYNDLQNEIDPDKMNEEIILISSITPSSRRAYEIARLFPGRKIIMGGVHVSALPHEAVEYADHVVVGECESKRKRAMAVLTSMKAEGIRPKVIAANSRLQVYKDRELLQ
ncbi:MAG: cobalamin-dependent protein, partial [Bacteroidales bacterium]|nr:cobalamin-dependent protein [Bacteroidales bacterium]